MIIRKSEIRVDKSNLRNGKGIVKREFIVEGENLRNKAKNILAKIFSKCIKYPKEWLRKSSARNILEHKA